MKIRMYWDWFKGHKPSHGPQTWPWWRLVSVRVYKLGLDPAVPVSGFRVWFYTRWQCPHWDIFLDRRVNIPAAR